MKARIGLSSMLMATLMAGVSQASAAVYDFYYGSLKVAALTTTGSTDFSFAFLAAPDLGSAFINDLLLDMTSGSFTNTTASSITTPSYDYKAGGFEGTGLQTKISFPTSDGPERLTVGETSTWTITGAFDGPARLHVNAFIGGESVKLVSVVPEPEAYAMALAALGVLGVFGQLRRSKT